MSAGIPVIICGKIARVAEAVKASLLPEYEVIHVILSVEAGVSQIPAVLRGEHLPLSDSEENMGTRNYAKPPVAIITGGGYNDATFQEMRDACNGATNVPWLRPDMSAQATQGPGSGAAIAERVKVCLGKLARDGKMDEDGVYLY